jgi:hypothetical protein
MKTTDSGKGIQEKYIQNLIQTYKREDKRDRNMDGISARIIGDSQAYKRIPCLSAVIRNGRRFPFFFIRLLYPQYQKNVRLFGNVSLIA